MITPHHPPVQAPVWGQPFTGAAPVPASAPAPGAAAFPEIIPSAATRALQQQVDGLGSIVSGARAAYLHLGVQYEQVASQLRHQQRVDFYLQWVLPTQMLMAADDAYLSAAPQATAGLLTEAERDTIYSVRSAHERARHGGTSPELDAEDQMELWVLLTRFRTALMEEVAYRDAEGAITDEETGQPDYDAIIRHMLEAPARESFTQHDAAPTAETTAASVADPTVATTLPYPHLLAAISALTADPAEPAPAAVPDSIPVPIPMSMSTLPMFVIAASATPPGQAQGGLPQSPLGAHPTPAPLPLTQPGMASHAA